MGEHRRQVPGWKDGRTSGSATGSRVKLGAQRSGGTPTSSTPQDAVRGMQRAAGNRATAAYLSGSAAAPIYNTPDEDDEPIYNTRDGDGASGELIYQDADELDWDQVRDSDGDGASGELIYQDADELDWDQVRDSNGDGASGELIYQDADELDWDQARDSNDDGGAWAGPAALAAPPSASGPKERIKYAMLRGVDSIYANETTDTSSFVIRTYNDSLALYLIRQGLVTGRVKKAMLMIERGTLPPEAAAAATSAAVREKVLVEHMGWSRDDVAKFGSEINTKTEYVASDEDREAYEVTGGRTLLQGGEPFDTTKPEPMYSKFSGKGWGIYVMGADGRMYAGTHKVGLFHHSSFLAGADTAGSGELKVVNGTLKGLSNKSGHYLPGDYQLAQVLLELRSHGVSLRGVKLKVVQPNQRLKTYEADTWFHANEFEGLLLENRVPENLASSGYEGDDDEEGSAVASPSQLGSYGYEHDDEEESAVASPSQLGSYGYEHDDEEESAVASPPPLVYVDEPDDW